MSFLSESAPISRQSSRRAMTSYPLESESVTRPLQYTGRLPNPSGYHSNADGAEQNWNLWAAKRLAEIETNIASNTLLWNSLTDQIAKAQVTKQQNDPEETTREMFVASNMRDTAVRNSIASRKAFANLFQAIQIGGDMASPQM
ncbi:hypothetical protein NW762_008410 [Fusarium torreyae]|uniref:Uncharacterized protein n=1 Tax=Fusarium torreyae TaxID=1237075 RepID=A0A9W8VDM7_9HYPO|nr:hypothetical protein NW762_008410 [Fusarium torreyae]